MARMGSGGSARRVRRQFSEEFKAGAVRLVLDEGKTVGAGARELDLTASALSLWVRQARADRTKGKSGLMKEEREELVRLRKEVRILAEERDILKICRAAFRGCASRRLSLRSARVRARWPYDCSTRHRPPSRSCFSKIMFSVSR